MMFVRLSGTFAVPRMSNQIPLSVASLPTPTMVVFEPGRIRTRACCAAADATRARSCGPLGLTRPHGPSGSNAASNASYENSSPVTGSGRK